jgi:hypothetical protein
MLAPLRTNPRRARVADGKSVPFPIEGWDAISSVAAMDPKRAIVLDNWFPQPGYGEIRKGYIPWATGMSTAINTIMVYNAINPANNKMFAAATTAIYDATSSGAVGAAVVSALTNGKWQYVNYTTSAGAAYLWCCNGVDAPRTWDGSSWATPAITGVTEADTINVTVHKKRIWGVLSGTTDAYYLGLDAVAGAATKFPLGSVFQRGGYLMAIGSWSLDSGQGPDDYIVFISSKGDAAVYLGSDPDVDFSLVGLFELAPPIGRRCFTKAGGDLAYISLDGVLPISKAISQDRAANALVAMTNRINRAMRDATRSYGANYGWELVSYPNGSMIILNVPVVAATTSHQYVMNSVTGAWCRFIGQNACTFAVFNDELYFGGTDGKTYKANTGGADNGTLITAIGQTAYNYYGTPGLQKRFTALQPLITTDQIIVPSVGVSTDFQDNAVISTPSAAATTAALYDAALYDAALYAVDSLSFSNWTTVSGFGQCAAIHFRAASNTSSSVIIRMNGFNITFEKGEFY